MFSISLAKLPMLMKYTPAIITIPTFSLCFCLASKTIIPLVLYMVRPATDVCMFEDNREGILQVWKLSLKFPTLCGLTHCVLLC